MKTVSRRKFLKTTLQAIAVLPVASMVKTAHAEQEDLILIVDKDGNATLKGMTLFVDKDGNATVKQERND
jgi:hypothetical protein